MTGLMQQISSALTSAFKSISESEKLQPLLHPMEEVLKKFINSTLADAANKMIARVRTHWKETIIFLAVIAGATKVFVNLLSLSVRDDKNINNTL